MKFTTYKFFLLLFFICSNAKGTHIVGGEFALTHINGYNYSLSLKMYFDAVNGDPTILTNPADQSLIAHIYRKRDNAFIEQVILYKTSTNNVNYTNPVCSIGSLSTLSLVFQGDLYLSPQLYDDSQGYYVVWERCCRNYIINNIYSPENTGQTFYLEFPAVVIDDLRFINSSPELFPPLSDYACVNRPFYFDFSGTDPDNDSLVYSLENPIAGSSSIYYPAPVPSPAPYREVFWLEGYGKSNMILGNPSLSVNPQTGFLFVTPSRTGLFVFGVKCEEFRNGKKIGEVRREFQMFVIDCPVNTPPKIAVTPSGNKVFDGKQDTVTFNVGEEKCFNFSIKDPEQGTKLNVKLRAVNFDNSFITPTQYSKRLLSDNDSLTFSICFPDCPLENEPYIVEVIAGDDGCSLPLLDTAILIVNVIPPPNSPATLNTSLSSNEVVLKAGSNLSFNVVAQDADMDSLKLIAIPVDFELNEVEIQFEEKKGKGAVSSIFSWLPKCDFLNLNEKDVYEVDFIVEETNNCQRTLRDTVRVKVKLEANPNSPPVISIDNQYQDNTITAYIGQLLEWNVQALDPDNVFISLFAEGKNFDLKNKGILFENKEGQSLINSKFEWAITCDDIVKDSLYELDFITYDKSCFGKNYDTITVRVDVKDIPSGAKEFLPPNVFTPNGDGKNDFFSLENIDPTSESGSAFSLPKDQCGNKFEEILIVNRWGRVVYQDNKRDFSWDGKGFPPGTYFYSLIFSKKLFKGTITIMH